jgi:glucosyl-dolichyl phosphate glucuronosyltransferase
MKVTVILCTYNRCTSLAKALETVALSKVPETIAWDVLVVDNNSRDQTCAVVESYSTRYPGRFKYLFESKQGKSNALNAGIRVAQGDVLVFMDDDVVVDPSWLWSLTAALVSDHWAGAGGPVFPLWNTPRPEWLSQDAGNILAPLVAFNPGGESGTLSEPPFGTNMAFKKKMFEKYGDFRTDLGPRPGSEIRSEDTEFGARLLRAGERLRYESSAVVFHPVTAERLTKRYFLNWWFAKGRADVIEFGLEPGTNYVVAGVPLRLFKQFAAGTVRWMLTWDRGRRFDRKRQLWALMGEILEHRQQRRSKSRTRSANRFGIDVTGE